MSKYILSIKPSGSPWVTQDPFIFCAYHKDDYPGGNAQLGPNVTLDGRNIGQDFSGKDGWSMYHGSSVPGFPSHPHRGFETVTIAQQGLVDHSDSVGAKARFGNGDVQWLTSGKGLQHAEMFPLLNKDKNPLVLFQLWLNLPQKSKFVDPHFKILWKEDIPVHHVKDTDGKTTIFDIIAGEFDGVKALSPTPDSWAANPDNEVQIWTVQMEEGAEITIPAAQDHVNRALYYYEGDKVEIDNYQVKVNFMAELASNEDIKIKNGNKKGRFLFLQGRPLGEPVVQYGPFVMNSEQEIHQAMVEYQNTQFGGWPWESSEVHHGKDKGRFALHENGEEEVRG